ncbi:MULTISPECIES: hypothetical protein [Corallococcus]|uniref:hypothetical protein n=1 Tax=Corallococcus TaxID=83461 RepID=UPI0011C3D4F4|nr:MULTISPECIES: hypothetical protein [Corallococcus]
MTDAPQLTPERLQARTTFGLGKAAPLAPDKATVATTADSADVLVVGKLSHKGPKFRLVYLLQSRQDPTLHTQLAYEFANPRLSDKGATSMGQDILKAASALEEKRLAQAAAIPAAPTVSTAPSPAPTVAAAPEPKAPVLAAAAPVPSSEAQDGYAPYGEEPALKLRQQPVVVIHLGLAGLMGTGPTTYGGGLILEPKWNITDKIAAGVRLEVGIAGGGSAGNGSATVSTAVAVASLLKGEYLFRDSGVRPFLGLGAGVYTLANQSVAAGNGGAGVAQSGGRFFGVAPQAGIDFGGIRLAASYNHILGADIVVEQNVNAGIEPERIKRNYFLLELSFRIAKFGRVNKPMPMPAEQY